MRKVNLGKFDLKRKNVLITGASSGIGKELSECFATEGANLLLGCHPSEGHVLAEWADDLHDTYKVHTATFPIDLSEERGPEKLYAAVGESVSSLDVLVNNAGVLFYGSFHEVPLEHHDLLVKVNLIAYFKLMRLFLADMIEAGEGRILNIVSAAAFQPTPYHASYGAAKAFIQSLSEAANQEIRGTGVKVLTFNPSYTDTQLLKKGGFPPRLRWYMISGLSDPKVMAHKAMTAFKAEKDVYIPGMKNWFVHSLLTRLTPRKLSNVLSRWVLRESR